MAAVYKVCGANVGGGRMALFRCEQGARPASALTALLRALLPVLLPELLPSSCALCAQACAGVVCPACQRDSVIARPRCPRCANPLPARPVAAATEIRRPPATGTLVCPALAGCHPAARRQRGPPAGCDRPGPAGPPPSGRTGFQSGAGSGETIGPHAGRSPVAPAGGAGD